MTLRTIRLVLAYDGTEFRGWATQRNPQIRTIEGEISSHLERVLQEAPKLSVAGRTDAGVHARGQVASFSTASALRPASLQSVLNAALAPEVVVTACSYAPEGFSARFSASAREYSYVIDTAPIPDPFASRHRWHRPGVLGVASMRAAARSLVGERDFASFCRHPGQDRSTVRDLQRLTVARDSDLVVIRARADAFLHQMVRSIVGVLVAVGEGRLVPRDVERIAEARSRASTPQPAPARGLTLERVIYGRRTPTVSSR